MLNGFVDANFETEKVYFSLKKSSFKVCIHKIFSATSNKTRPSTRNNNWSPQRVHSALDKSSYIYSSESKCTCLPFHCQDVFHLVRCMSRDCVCTWTRTHLRLVVWRTTGVCFETWVIYIWFRCAVWPSVPVVERLDIRLMYRCTTRLVGRGFNPHRERIFFTQNFQFQSLHPQNIFSN